MSTPGPVEKFHSVVRWNKPLAEIDAAAKEAGDNAANQKDAKTGNTAIHIAAQNGHLALTKHIVEKLGADVNITNGKGNTALHMSVEYDFYKQTVYLRSKGGKDDIKNSDGSQAIFGLGDTKRGDEAWDSPLTILKACDDDPADIKAALDNVLEQSKKGNNVDKGNLVGTALQKKKQYKNWDQAAFQALVKQLP